MIGLPELKKMSLPELEALWKETPLGPAPLGTFRGAFLRWVDSPGARKLQVRAFDTPAFVWAPFGIDFDARAWWFFHKRALVGRFDLTPGRSRWRDTEAQQVRYGASRLPGMVKDLLYDEVKRVSEDVAIGLGGLNADAGEGDHFFFALGRD